MKRLALAALAVVALSAAVAPARADKPLPPGCDDRKAVTHYARGVSGIPPRAGHPLIPCVSPVGIPGYETTIGVAPDGTVYYQGYSSALAKPAPQVAMTRDSGRTWTDVSPKIADVQTHQASLDPYLTVDPLTGRVFTTDYMGFCANSSFSDDHGQTWTTVELACTQQDHQTVFTGKPRTSTTLGYPNVVYYCAMSGGASLASTMSTCSKSLDGGVTFVPTGTPAFTDDPSQTGGDFGIPGACGGRHGQGISGRDGTIYLPRNWCGHPYLAISHDEGLTWERHQVGGDDVAMSELGMYEAETGVALGPNGELYYVFSGRDRMPRFSVSRDGGATWSRSVAVAPPGVTEAILPDIAASKDGRVAFMYLGSTDSNGAPFHECYDILACVASGDPSSTSGYEYVSWNAYITQTDDPLSATPVFQTAAINAPGDPIARGSCGPRPNRCNLGDFQDITYGPDGAPWISMVDACTTTCVRPTTDAERTNDATVGIVGRLVAR